MISIFQLPYQRTKAFYRRYERILIPAMLVFGFVVDYITFRNIQVSTVLTVLLFYFVISGITIAFIHYYDAGRINQRMKFVRLFSPLVVQFTFGALLGASFIFYWFSASLAASWPFFVVIALLMASNEVFRRHFLKPVVQISVYYFIAFSFLSISLPYVLNRLDARLFLYTGLISLVFIYAYVRLLFSAKGKLREQKLILSKVILIIFVGMNTLYFANIIPPIPLSLREAGVYHDISRSGNNYILNEEREPFFRRIIPGKTVHLRLGDPLYLYTAIFAPADLKTSIYHDWRYYDKDKRKWLERDNLYFDIMGGRRDGYRGYSVKTNLTEGKWRVYVKNQNNQLLGRITFRVKKTDENVELEEIRR
jgi:hypothetical protein